MEVALSSEKLVVNQPHLFWYWVECCGEYYVYAGPLAKVPGVPLFVCTTQKGAESACHAYNLAEQCVEVWRASSALGARLTREHLEQVRQIVEGATTVPLDEVLPGDD